jgi:hypothetical protein
VQVHERFEVSQGPRDALELAFSEFRYRWIFCDEVLRAGKQALPLEEDAVSCCTAGTWVSEQRCRGSRSAAKRL